ncbi:aldehyde dehydrogenase family protein [Hymenobacter sp. YC55]|uniref:aldehyde dehydrogenase family protein n=1 Tax=Hymenobacter sp. YC55 TaxID=3034019 RepID=UPI0023F902BD|nr:aldehyde dehydrogenase family protein [Hymenobacter sp. YC55]MDF7813967.1 aldehyde dehydrogenase family protein [Hymenobacter sp. YC55]
MRNILETVFPLPEDIPAAYQWTGPLHQHDYLLNGSLETWSGPFSPVHSPVHVRGGTDARPVELGSYPLFSQAQALQALQGAVEAYQGGQGRWPRMSVAERIRQVELFTQRLQDRRADVIQLLLWEIAMPLAEAEREFDRTVDYIQATIAELKAAERIEARPFLAEQHVAQVRRVPLGVTLCMGPFNHPLSETFRLLIPALLMGNTVLFKPSQHGTLVFQPLLTAFQAAFPAGVVNTLYGRGHDIIPALMQSGQVSVLALVGASHLADRLKKLHPNVNRLRAVLSLDSKNAGIVLADAHLPTAVEECLAGAFCFNGQRGPALKILFVHRAIVTQFIQRLCDRLKQAKIGMPWETDVVFTPLTEPNKPDYLEDCLDDALELGAAIMNVNGGVRFHSLFYPAVVYPVTEHMKLYREEQFGPLLPIVPFDELDEPIRYIAESSHGQQVSLFGQDPDRMAYLLDALVHQVSRINLNGQSQREPDSLPFTGRKDSAEGTLSVADTLDAFSIRAVVTAPQTLANQELVQHILHGHKSRFLATDFIF